MKALAAGETPETTTWEGDQVGLKWEEVEVGEDKLSIRGTPQRMMGICSKDCTRSASTSPIPQDMAVELSPVTHVVEADYAVAVTVQPVHRTPKATR
jgi:hypothetical protein